MANIDTLRTGARLVMGMAAVASMSTMPSASLAAGDPNSVAGQVVMALSSNCSSVASRNHTQDAHHQRGMQVNEMQPHSATQRDTAPHS